MSRKLASVRVVSGVAPIPNADQIEVAQIDGWSCVVKKGELQEGTKCVYFEVDSFLPANDARFGFLEPKFTEWQGKRGMRLRTIKLRGQLSQGLALPLSNFPELADVEVGDDVTEQLGIEKWERPLPASLTGLARGNFPAFVPKTDQERVQNLPQVFEKYADEPFEVTMKLDGSSMTAYIKDGVFGVCSRNLDLKETEGNAFWRAARKQNLEEALRKIVDHVGYDIALQGELVGDGIQGNYEKMPAGEQQFFLFDAYLIGHNRYAAPHERWDLLDALNMTGAHVPHVPIFHVIPGAEQVVDQDTNIPVPMFKLGSFAPDMDAILQLAEGVGMNEGVKREGLVFKHIGGKFSFKAISNSYLLSEK